MSHTSPIAYSIQTKAGFKLDIALVETDSLLLHEETIPEMLEDLVQRIEEDGVLMAPVVVDKETTVVLDGMHRVEALRILGCRFTCACLVDYKSPEIKVMRWCRTFSKHGRASMTISKPFDIQEVVKVAEELDLRLAPRAIDREIDLARPYSMMLLGDSCYDVLTSSPDLLSAFDAVRELELRLRDMGFEVGYRTAQEAKEMLKLKSVVAVLFPPKIEKEHVIETAKKGRVFTFKATRHIVPARPVGVDVPLSLLRDLSLSVEEANERLSALLSQKRLRHLPQRGIWRGRRYDEDLYLFEDQPDR